MDLPSLILILIMSLQTAGEDVALPAHIECRYESFSRELQQEFESVDVIGFFVHGFEKSIFNLKGTNDEWWVWSHELKRHADELSATKIEVRVRGLLSPEGGYGQSRRFSHCLANIDVVSVFGAAED